MVFDERVGPRISYRFYLDRILSARGMAKPRERDDNRGGCCQGSCSLQRQLVRQNEDPGARNAIPQQRPLPSTIPSLTSPARFTMTAVRRRYTRFKPILHCHQPSSPHELSNGTLSSCFRPSLLAIVGLRTETGGEFFARDTTVAGSAMLCVPWTGYG